MSTKAYSTRIENPGCHQNTAKVLRLYKAFFNRNPDKNGANYWINLHTNTGVTIERIAENFGNSKEFGKLYSNMKNQDFVSRIYNNVLNRQPDPNGHAYWTKRLNEGLSRVKLVQFVSDGIEFRRLNPHPPSSFCKAVMPKLAGYLSTSPHPGVVHAKKNANGQSINLSFIDVDRIGTKFRVSPGRDKKTVGTYAQQISDSVAINGNWFSAQGFDGPSVSGGVNYGGRNHSYTALFGFDESGRVHVEKHEYEGPLPKSVTNGVAGHPTLTWDNENKVRGNNPVLGDPTNSNRHPRSAIGTDKDRSYIVLATVDDRRPDAKGMTAAELADLMTSAGAAHSTMLDGGGSSTMWIKNRGIVNQPSDGRPRAVGNELVIKTGVWIP